MSLEAILDFGCRPYITTSKHLLSSFDLYPLGVELNPFIETESDAQFHLSYLRANGLSFDADVGMPNWVYVDYVMLQTAAVGFMLPQEKIPRPLLERFKSDKVLKLDQLPYLPISGQIAGLAVDRQTWTGVSLFSLAKFIPELKSLGVATFTRAIALTAYKAKKFIGITQYDNPAVAIHGKTTKRFYLTKPIVWVHPRTHMTFIYEQEIDFTVNDLRAREDESYSFLLKADDLDAKRSLESELASGVKFRIVPPFQIRNASGVFLPIERIAG